jgi:hypothetical protein
MDIDMGKRVNISQCISNKHFKKKEPPQELTMEL